MSLSTILAQNDSNKVVLLEIDKPTIITGDVWIPQGMGVWSTKYWWDETLVKNFRYGLGAWGYGPYGSSANALALPTSPVGRDKLFKLSTFFADMIPVTNVIGVYQCQNLANSFYFDITNQILYFHPTNGLDPSLTYSKLEVGIVQGYSNYSGYYNSQYFDGRISSVGNITTKRDPLFFGSMSYDASNVTLLNTDGYFDDFVESDYFGTKVRLYLGSKDLTYSQFEPIYTGYLDEFAVDYNKFTMKIKDLRSQMTNKIGTNLYTKAEYPYLANENVNKVKPLVFGIYRGIKPICLNETEVTTTYDFLIADTAMGTIQTLNQVYVDGFVVTPTSLDLSTNTFSLSSIDYEAGKEVVIYGTGYDSGNTNPFFIMKKLLLAYSNCLYTSNFFNITSWDNLILGFTDQRVSFNIVEPTPIIDVINTICSSCFALFTIGENGTYEIQVVEPNLGNIMGTINLDEVIGAVGVKVSSKEYISSISINYDKNYAFDTYYNYLNTASEDILYQKYRQKVRKEVDTILTYNQDAVNYATKAMDLWGSIGPTYTLTTPLSKLDFSVGVRYQLEVEPLKYVAVEVLSKVVDLNSNLIKFELKYIEDITVGVNPMAIIRYNGWKK